MATTEAPYSISFKTQRSTLITVRGETHDELATRLAMMSIPISTPDGPESVVDMIGEIERALTGSSSGGASQGASQPAQQSSLTPPCKTCGGATTEKTGTGKRGPWKGYFCSVQGHDVQWAS
jgi:hypothetical protein